MAKHKSGDHVYLGEFDNGDEVVPAQRVTLTERAGGMWIAVIHPDDRTPEDADDGLVEFEASQIDESRGKW